MKKIYAFIVILLMVIIPVKVSAREGISNYYIDSTINSDGSVSIKELIVLNGQFNGFKRIINYKNDSLKEFDGSINSFRGSDIYNGDGISLASIKNIKINNQGFDSIFSDGDTFKEVESADKGDYGKYITTINSNGEEYTIYNPDKGSKKGFYIEYTISNMGVVHNDISELAMNLFTELTEYVDNLEMHIHIPNNNDLLRAWAHGPLTGNITIKNNNLVVVNASKIEPNDPIDVRLAFDKSVLSDSTKKSNVSALDSIISIETELANQANLEREQARKELESIAVSSVERSEKKPTRSNYKEAIGDVNYLPAGELKSELNDRLNIVLTKVEEREALIAKIYGLILFAWIIGLIILIYFVYKKYDKEYKAEFTGDYYRDFPASYGPEILGYLLNKKIGSNDLSAAILNLINKKVIIVEKNPESKKEDYILKNTNITDNLTEQEVKAIKLVFNECNETTLNELKKRAKSNYEDFISDFDSWKTSATKASLEQNFYEKNSKEALCGLYCILGLILGAFLIINNGYFIFNLLVLVLAFISLIYFASIKKRTKSGNEDYHKWMGLKKFLKDFSTIDTKSLPEVALWEKYLVYAIPLGCAKKLSKDMQIKVKELENINTNNMDMFDVMYMMRFNHIINSTITSSVGAAFSERTRQQMSDISNSSNSSGSGFGGGFSSGGGSFGGGGGGGRF